MSSDDALRPGAELIGPHTTRLAVWAPCARRVDLLVISPEQRLVPMERGPRGYFTATADGLGPGADYYFRLGGKKQLPDPASKLQPQGVHGPSRVIDLAFPWTDGDWTGPPLREYIIYELHVGCYSKTGDFDGVRRRLDTLAELGVTAIELMPVVQFPGRRNWGYDGAFPYAVQNSYGGPRGLQRLVDACHQRNLAVVLDVVYNHLGPEGNYFRDYGPYFTDRYHTPWGRAINFDGPQSDEVRRFFIENALYWIRDFHIDALRLDAIQMIFDNSARPVLRELAAAVHEEGRKRGRLVHVIGETNQNDVRQVTPVQQGGWGLDAVWSDDFHHSLHALLTGERMSVYVDFGRLEDAAAACRDAFVLAGQYSRRHKRRHGSRSGALAGDHFIICAQNHDQVGNRLYGERLSQLVSFEAVKLAASFLLLAPYAPLLFMGEEYAETAPFLYFVDHSDPKLLERVRQGRLRDYTEFLREGEPVPDPTAESTFRRSRLRHDLRLRQPGKTLWAFYRRLIELRKGLSPLAELDRRRHEVVVDRRAELIQSRRWSEGEETVAMFHFGACEATFAADLPRGVWTKVLDSADSQWRGPGEIAPGTVQSSGRVELAMTPHAAALFVRAGPSTRMV